MAKTSESSLHPQQRYRAAMATLIADRWDVLWKAVPAAMAGDDIEGVHDVRVASRRLRAAMDVAVECFPASWYRPLHDTAKEITGALGEVRDRDVLLAFLEQDRAAAAAEEGPGLDRLIDRVTAERDAARLEMERYFANLNNRGIAREAKRRFAALQGNREAAR